MLTYRCPAVTAGSRCDIAGSATATLAVPPPVRNPKRADLPEVARRCVAGDATPPAGVPSAR